MRHVLKLTLFVFYGAVQASTLSIIGGQPSPRSDNAISDDGTTVVSGIDRRWTEASGVWEILVPTVGYVHDVSADGSVVVGGTTRWTSGGSINLGGVSTTAHGVSADGNIVVGHGSHNDPPYGNNLQPFIWTKTTETSGTMTYLGHIDWTSYRSSEAFAVSADGTTVVGRGYMVYNGLHDRTAFRWTAAEGMHPLGNLGWRAWSEAFDVSADGSVVVGYDVMDGNNSHVAFRWENDVMTSLGDLPGGTIYSLAYGVSADGSVIVGQGQSDLGQEAVIWTEVAGVYQIQRLQDVLEAGGVTIPFNYYLGSAQSISADGKTIMGQGLNNKGQDAGIFIAHLADKVAIDIIPTDPSNYIETEGLFSDKVGVAVLSTNVADGEATNFDAPSEVDAATLKFGPNRAAIFKLPATVRDVDHDGDNDLLAIFRIVDTGIACEHPDDAILIGETFGGVDIEGSDSVTTPDCPTTGCHP